MNEKGLMQKLAKAVRDSGIATGKSGDISGEKQQKFNEFRENNKVASYIKKYRRIGTLGIQKEVPTSEAVELALQNIEKHHRQIHQRAMSFQNSRD